MLKCSVVIPTYNRARLLRHTLRSLARQSLARDEFEVLVVDDGSSDDTRAVVDGFRGRLNLGYRFQEDEGFRAALARNTGIRDAASDVCVFIDSGMIAHSRCLEAHVASHAAEQRAAVVGYVYCLMFEDDDDAAAEITRTLDFDDADGSIALLRERRSWPDLREDFYERYGDEFADLPAPWVVWWTCNVSARTAQLAEVGMFDEAFRGWGAEDLDLAFRLFSSGARFVLNRDAACVHLPHPKAAKAKSEVPNLEYIARKYDTPIVNLLPGFATSEVTHLTINDIIRERGLAG
jgi:glycosyltransferase involved in cell wall biosynthesis